MKKTLKVTLVKSPISAKAAHQATVRGLGLKRMRQTRELEDTPAVRGMLTLRKEGEGLVTAADIELPHDVEIVNPDHVIAHLSGGGRLELQIKVEKGRGYVPGNVRAFREDHSKAIGKIVMDASFSPVKRVSYAVEAARVEQRTDLDKLVMTIETNGAMTPEEAVRQSARILMDQLQVFGALEGMS